MQRLIDKARHGWCVHDLRQTDVANLAGGGGQLRLQLPHKLRDAFNSPRRTDDDQAVRFRINGDRYIAQLSDRVRHDVGKFFGGGIILDSENLRCDGRPNGHRQR